jgi:glycine/D-amino acid oxidase-like deaminating enzyme
MEIDFLIIGQGLAGSALAYRLIKDGKQVVLLDQPEANRSSQVAAGLFNPVTGRKMVKTWKGELLFPEIVPFYQELEEVTGRKFLTQQSIYRPFLSIEEQNEWMGHSSDPALQPFVQKIEAESQHKNLKDPFGGVKLQLSGWLDIPTFLEGMVAYFGDRLIQEEFKEENLLPEGDAGWSYGALKTKALIYCNGLGSMQSRFFSFLPFAPVKGEILELKQDF